METVPTITMDCVDNIEIFLSPTALGVELVSSKSTSINVSVTGTSGDYVCLLVVTHFSITFFLFILCD